MIYFIILLCISNIISIIYLYKERKKIIKERKKNQATINEMAGEAFQQLCIANKNKIEQELAQWREVQEGIIRHDLEKETQIANLQKENLKTEIEAQKNQLSSLKENQEEALREHQKKVEVQVELAINERRAQEFDNMVADIEAFLTSAAAQKSAAQNEINEILEQLEQFKKKRDAINEEILRSRAIEEKEEFFKVQLDSQTLHDLAIIEEIRPQLSKTDFLDKFIYDIYIAKPVTEMVKRVLNGEAPSGIYKITRLKTGEIYIGKSTDVKARWIQHIKTCFNCGTISHSSLHTIMKKDKIQNFTFELLEKVEKSKLTEREKYYIEFYDSKNFGLNERNG